MWHPLLWRPDPAVGVVPTPASVRRRRPGGARLGESQSAKVQVSKLLRQWHGPTGFFRQEGKAPKVRYFPKATG